MDGGENQFWLLTPAWDVSYRLFAPASDLRRSGQAAEIVSHPESLTGGRESDS